MKLFIAYRRTNKRKETLEAYPPLKDDEVVFIKPFVARWKNNSLFSVLMRYRGLKLQDFFNFSQQVNNNDIANIKLKVIITFRYIYIT